MKRRIVALFALLIIFLSAPSAAYAEATAPKTLAASNPPVAEPQVEEKEWVHRIDEDGYLWRRLWSITYGKWLTDWILMGYVGKA